MSEYPYDEPGDDEVRKIMKDGGLKLCEEAKAKWLSPTYYAGFDSKIKYANVERWRKIQERIKEIA